MERSWLPAIAIGGGAIALVSAFVLLSGAPPPSATDAGTASPLPAAVVPADAAPVVTFDAALPTSTVLPPVVTAALDAPPPAAAVDASPVLEGPATSIRARIAQLTREIADLEKEGKHEEAVQKGQLLKRMQAKLDAVENGL